MRTTPHKILIVCIAGLGSATALSATADDTVATPEIAAPPIAAPKTAGPARETREVTPQKPEDRDTQAERGPDLHDVMLAAADRMTNMPVTGNTDRDFVAAMKQHHRDAIAMAAVMLRQGSDPALKRMAQRITDTQTKDIADFDLWLMRQANTRAKAPVAQSLPTPDPVASISDARSAR